MILHSYVNSSFVNGPGNRFVIWTQGCTKGCKNCYNPETWNKNGFEYTAKHLFNLISIAQVDGLTISGGDPLEQPDELLKLLKLVKKLNLKKGVILFTGYTLNEINEISGNTKKCLDYIDLLIDGRYEEKQRLTHGLRGSENQNYYFFSDVLKKEEIEFDHSIEIGNVNGKIYITGFPVLINLNKYGLKYENPRNIK